ncbi:MAG TPA: PEP-CTERM sorting domain-containing protein [Bryobacteraceae bacterium]|nr:PEP-CTERM sorting domain-containing protein [Bryobacteraceae bacterium]
MKKSVGILFVLAGALSAAPVVFQAGGANAASIQGTVDAYRAALGSSNPNQPTSFVGGRREVNWDGVPATASSPNPFPGDFFNGGVAGRARGIEFTTPGTALEVSSNAGAGPIEFDNIDASYSGLFAAFSPQKLFTAIGSNIVDVHFFLPSDQTTAAVTRGFGAVFTDVDLANTTSLEYFDMFNQSLGTYYASAVQGNETLSFVGVLFDDATRIGRVRITSGNAALGGPETSVSDLVAMDDFIYAEPEGAVPEPGTWMMLSGGIAAFGVVRMRRAHSRS